MPPVYHFIINRKGRRWKYRVLNHADLIVEFGFARSRLAARYRAERALFAALLRACIHKRRSQISAWVSAYPLTAAE
jgi:hypothetical protein